MNNSWLSKVMVLAMSIAPLLSFNSLVEAQTKRNVYNCINYQGKPSTVVDTDKGRILLIAWESDFFRGSGWTPQKRCDEVSRRFQEFSDNKQLRYLTTGTMNRQKVICVGKATGGSTYQCIDDGLLLTLEGNNDNPNQVLKDLFKATKSSSDFIRRKGNKYVLDLDILMKTAAVISDSSMPQTSTPQVSPAQISTPPISEPPKENPDCPSLFCD